MDELSFIILTLGKAIDRAIVCGQPSEDLEQAYEAALRLCADQATDCL